MKRKEREAKRRRAERRAAGATREVRVEELKGIVERTKAGPLCEADVASLTAAVETLVFLTQELATRGASLERLRRLLFGSTSEKARDVLGGAAPGGGDGAGGDGGAPAGPAGGGDGTAGSGGAPAGPAGGGDGTAGSGGAPAGAAGEPTKRPKVAGHGRNGAAAYRGATKVKVPHADLRCGGGCPECGDGKTYPLSEPAVLVRVTGMAPLGATLYECERLRCNLCGEVFTANAPSGVGDKKYDESVPAMIGLLKYGTGLPFNRIEKLQQGMGIPLPASTQWELVEEAARVLAPAHEELLDEAAQAEVLYNDDTSMKILELSGEERAQVLAHVEDAEERTGVFTSGIVATGQGHRIALFFTGPKHAGENLNDVLRRRAAALGAPIQMCDALSRNVPSAWKTVLANCLSHARRHFVEVVDDFPEECRYLIEQLGAVYHNDALARERGLSPEERLRFHQAESGPVMARIKKWLHGQVHGRKVEPNSGLGKAIEYMRGHWMKLALFLRVAGAPLDNNICERALKKAILHRKNGLFYKTLKGAHVGDVFMSLIHTAELNGTAPFDYLVALQRHHEALAKSPREWMPWNYQDTLARLAHGPSPPSA